MPVYARAVGAEIEPRTVEVSTRMVLAYAAAIGETGPRTFDDAGVEPLVAPPPFCVVLEWPVLSSPERMAWLGMSPQEARQVVHVEQDSTFHRVIRPGDRLATSARITGVRATGAGALVHTRLSTVDAADGAAVVTTWHGAIYRGVGVEGEGGATEGPPERPAATDEPTVRVPIPIAREMAHVYTECSGIWNPIHTERRVARAAGLPDIILHGTATWALAGRELLRVHGQGNPVCLRRLRASFAAPVVPGSTVTLVYGRRTTSGEVPFVVTGAGGRAAVTNGVAAFTMHDLEEAG